MRTEIKNLDKAAKRLIKAAKKGETVIVYGDADLDGVGSAIILAECLQNIGAKAPVFYFPDRENEGYGIIESALEKLKQYIPCLLVTVDCGIGNYREVAKAKKMGFEVIVVDHHEILKKLPPADIVVDPKQKGDKYPFKYFAAAGVVFKLAQIILKEKMTENLTKNFLELVAMATIADMMPLEEDNKEMVDEGLVYLQTSWRPGTQALFQLEDLKQFDFRQKVSKINSLLNIRDVESSLPAAFRILTCKSEEEARKMAISLLEKSAEKRERIKQIIEEVKARIAGKEKEPAIFEGDSSWEVILLGVVASILCQDYPKPIFLYKKTEKESHGSCRAPKGVNIVEPMKKCDKFLITYGGHPQAGGFRIKNENLEEFKKCLFDYFLDI